MLSQNNKKRFFFCLVILTFFIAGACVHFVKKNSWGTSLLVSNNAISSCPQDLHYSYSSNKEFFDEAYEKAPTTPTVQTAIKGIIVNHHLLAPHIIASAFKTIATKKPVTVVLISPNHFSTGQGKITSSLYAWDTPYGALESNCAVVNNLSERKLLKVDEFPFKKEHGISGIIPFIKKSLPNARIIPIVVKDSLKESEIISFVDELYKMLGDDVIVIGSFDFSHYLPSNVADFHDAQALSVISSFDYYGVKKMEIDSKPGIELVMRYLEKEKAQTFTLFSNTNSAKVIRDLSIEETTSYVTGAFSLGEKAPIQNRAVTILSFGDMMLDRYVRKQINEKGQMHPFTSLTRLLMGNDIVVTNLEGSFTNFPSETLHNPSGPLTFTFDPSMLPILKKLGFTLFSQANNHALNFGRSGLNESEQHILDSGLSFFGDPSNSSLKSYTTNVRGQKITFIGYHQFAYQGLEIVIEEIKTAKENGSFTIVYPHWGEEYKVSMTQSQIDTAHQFIDAGADLILGAHPHVIQPVEIYKGKAIFYSLGNFIFDQSSRGPTSEGLAIGVTIKNSEVIYDIFPLKIKNAQASLMSHTNRAILLNNLATISSTSPELIREGRFTLPK